MVLRKISLLGALFAALLGPACAPMESGAPVPSQAAAVAHGRNPVFPAADPHLTIAEGRYWIYPTTPRDPRRPEWRRLRAWASDDLRTWTPTGPIFSFDGVEWIKRDGRTSHGLWAPALAQANGRFYLYYSVGPQAEQAPSRLGVAVGDRPEGPFKDSGGPLLTGTWDKFEAIDPMVFLDPRSGAPFLYLGGSQGKTLRVFELERTMTAFKREVPIQQPWHFTEAPFMHERRGTYYLSYSHGNWDRSNYSVHYSTAPTPTGPWTYQDVILSSDAARKGPGHHSIVQNPRTGEWFIAYHRWERTEHGPYEGDRQVAVQRLTHNADGTIQPIRMDDGPPPLSPLRRP